LSNANPQGEITTLPTRVGIGEDRHRLGPGGPLRLGGIEIPHHQRAIGHSDADVLLHAVTDALLGAAALGDIGELFPNTDAVNRDRDSAEMLEICRAQVAESGLRVVNLDCTVLLERPKLSPYKEAMRQRIAEILRVTPDRVGLKAKTGEATGAVGREEVVEARCVVLLEEVDTSAQGTPHE
jgi:2-C-methyl-D-erythritol 2,4-cyclodiphosphate synthase